jgi:hypothetical protein
MYYWARVRWFVSMWDYFKPVTEIHDRDEYARVQRRFLYVLLVQLVCVVVLGGSACYVFSRYPALSSTNEYIQTTSKKTWSLMCTEGSHRDPDNVNCDRVADSAFMNVKLVSVLQALHEILDYFHLDMAMLGCGVGSSCSYMLTKAVDTLISYSWLLFLAAAVITCLVAYWMTQSVRQFRVLRKNRTIFIAPAPRKSTATVEEINDGGEALCNIDTHGTGDSTHQGWVRLDGAVQTVHQRRQASVSQVSMV